MLPGTSRYLKSKRDTSMALFPFVHRHWRDKCNKMPSVVTSDQLYTCLKLNCPTILNSIWFYLCTNECLIFGKSRTVQNYINPCNLNLKFGLMDQSSPEQH